MTVKKGFYLCSLIPYFLDDENVLKERDLQWLKEKEPETTRRPPQNDESDASVKKAAKRKVGRVSSVLNCSVLTIRTTQVSASFKSIDVSS